MPLWKIRVILPNGPRSHDALARALAAHPASRLRVESRGPGTTEMTGDAVVELRDDEPLGELLRALHEISRQVFVSRTDPPGPPAAARGIRVRPLGGRLGLRLTSRQRAPGKPCLSPGPPT
jgi:hypothetical protein